MFKMKQGFTDPFDAQCQEEALPPLLLSLLAMVLYGPSLKTQSSSSSLPQPALTLSQLLMPNTLGRKWENSFTSRHTTRHSQDRETPLPIYVGVMIHTQSCHCGRPLSPGTMHFL